MSIRYKTALIFLMTGLIPFLAIGSLVYLDFQSALRDNAFHSLEAITNLQEERVVDLLNIYSQGTANFGQQAAIRQVVQTYAANPNPATRTMLGQSLLAIQAAVSASNQVESLQGIVVTDPDGKVAATTASYFANKTLPVNAGRQLADINNVGDKAYMLFGAPMVFSGKTLARFYLAVDDKPLVAILQTREGLGQTGETFLVKRLDAGNGVFATPLRFNQSAAFNLKVPLNEANRPSAQAVLQKDETFTTGAVSYRGQPVVAVTRYINAAGLGIVGQIDRQEVYGPINQLAIQVVVFAALLVLFTVFVSSFMSELFVRPILNMANAAGRVSRGDFSARTKILTRDEIGQLGQTFNSMAEDLAKQDQAKSEVLALISHQLRTPVTAVKGFVSLVLQDKKTKLSDDETKMLKLAFEENEKLNGLITRILDVAHADSGKLDLKKQPTDLVKLVKRVVKDHEPTLKLRQQTIAAKLPTTTMTANVDPEKFGFVVANLLTNASKYSPVGSQVTVTMTQNLRHYRITVTDRGLGISSADQHKLFQKFSRIENKKRDTAEGVGLGLYMANKIVELHKGTLKVDSRENQGSSFTIELPIKA